MTPLHFGAAVKLIQSKTAQPASFGPVSEDTAVTRRFDDYVNARYDADTTLVLTPGPNQRVVVTGEDFEPLQEELYHTRQKIYGEDLAVFRRVAESSRDRVELAEREIARRYVQKAEADGRIIDLDA